MNISNANTANPVTSIASQSFDAWGNQLSSTGSINQYSYTGREADEDGLIYNRARYRNPQTDRFLNRDPIGLGGGINQYSYVSGNPINDTDALGLTARSPLANMLVANDASYFTGVMSDVGQGLGNLAKSAANSAANGLNHVLDACGDFCDPGVQASIGDVPGAALIGGLRGLAELGAVGTEVGSVAKSAGQLGREGEAAVRAAYDIGSKPTQSIIMNGNPRIPDGLNLRLETLSEVKNVQSLSFTSQLRDYSGYAQEQGLTFNTYVRPGANLSKPLLDARNQGLVNILEIPF